MPELPEVDWMVERLVGWTAGRSIAQTIIHRFRNVPTPNDIATVGGAQIQSVRRRGKYILFHLDRGILLGHNAMSGYWDMGSRPGAFAQIEGARPDIDTDIRIELDLDNGEKLRYHDARMFGSLAFYPTQDLKTIASLAELGGEAIRTLHSEPEAPLWTLEDFKKRATKGKRPIKTFLLDQERVAGVGNIYASEGLWVAGVHPTRKVGELSDTELSRVHEAIQDVMGNAIRCNIDYSKYLRAYRCENCFTCKTPISRIIQAGRATYFCSTCQK